MPSRVCTARGADRLAAVVAVVAAMAVMAMVAVASAMASAATVAGAGTIALPAVPARATTARARSPRPATRSLTSPTSRRLPKPPQPGKQQPALLPAASPPTSSPSARWLRCSSRSRVAAPARLVGGPVAGSCFGGEFRTVAAIAVIPAIAGRKVGMAAGLSCVFRLTLADAAFWFADIASRTAGWVRPPCWQPRMEPAPARPTTHLG